MGREGVKDEHRHQQQKQHQQQHQRVEGNGKQHDKNRYTRLVWWTGAVPRGLASLSPEHLPERPGLASAG